MIDGAQQCSVLQVISGDTDAIIHCWALLLRGVRVLVLFVLFVLRDEVREQKKHYIIIYGTKRDRSGGSASDGSSR